MVSSPLPSHEVHKTIRTFGWASFLNDFGADMIFSVWPLFLTQVLGANMAVVGLVDGVGDMMVSLSQAASGYLSDRIRKRKFFVWMGYFFGAVARLGYAVATSWPMVLPFRILDRSGKIRSSPRDAIVSDVSQRGNRGAHFGFLRMMDNLGAVCGIVASILLIRILPLRTIFVLAAIPSLLGVLLVLTRVRDLVPGGKIFRGIRLGDISANLTLYIVANAFLELATFSYSFLLLAAMAHGFAVRSIPVLYLIFTVAATLISIPAGRLADRFGRRTVLLLSLLLWSMVTGLFVTASGLTGIAVAFVLYGLHKGMLDPVQKTLVAELAPKQYVASVLGGFQLVVGLCSLPASLIAGLLWDRYGLTAPFVASVVLTAVAAGLLLFVREE
ncbi:MAG: hypothetical protein Greene041619_670 [Candidatus Peregrinibacteria bacterium Greene0416_19]|nr:MAG: hypothetical protein Greene041619_670 [Candidatus Peregrinibacteria bacterium Greene0416_19]